MNAGHDKTKQFLERLWRLENDERPGFILGYLGPEIIGGEPVPSALFSTEGEDSVRDRLQDPDRYLAAQLKEIEGQRRLPGDYIPALCPSLGVVAVPSAFGCAVIWRERDFPAVQPIILDRPEKVWELKPPSLTSGVLGRILDYVRRFRNKTSGRYPIRLTDLQGPLDNAALIWGHNDFLLALTTHQKEVHHLLGMITDLTIDFVHAMANEAQGAFVPSLFQPWMPKGFGISVCNDASVMISPSDHDTFSVPYLNRLSDAFNGIFVHSCGNWLHQIPSLEKVRNLRGVEFGASETPFEEVAERLNGKVVLACRVGLNRDQPFSSMVDFVRHIQNKKRTNRGLFIHVDITNGLIGPGWPPTDIAKICGLLRQ